MNSDQKEYWNGEAGERWVQEAKQLDALLTPILDALLDALAPQPGERVVDIGCGAGALAHAAAAKVGATGYVTGVDVSRPLLAHAQARFGHPGSNMEFIEGDATTVSLPDKFDVMTSRFGVMFFEDPTLAFKNIHAQMTSSGRLCFACWQPMMLNEWLSLPLSIAAEFLTELPKPEPRAPGPFAFAEADYVRDILSAAGWTSINIAPWTGALPTPGTSLEAAERLMKIGPISRLLAEQNQNPAPVRDRIAERLDTRRAANGQDELDAAIWIVTASV